MFRQLCVCVARFLSDVCFERSVSVHTKCKWERGRGAMFGKLSLLVFHVRGSFQPAGKRRLNGRGKP